MYKWLFQLDDEPNLYIGNGWKSPFPSVEKTGGLWGSREIRQIFRGPSEINQYSRSIKPQTSCISRMPGGTIPGLVSMVRITPMKISHESMAMNGGGPTTLSLWVITYDHHGYPPWHLKVDGWNTTFLLGWPIFRGGLLVSGRVTAY